MFIHLSDRYDTEKIYFAVIVFLFGYFLFRSIFFATHISHYIPPDEVTHFAICKEFSESILFPERSPENYHLGVINKGPYLYYLVMGNLLRVNISFFPDLIYLRLMNCLISLFTVYYGYKWIKIVTEDRLSRILFLVLITNTPMFTMVSSSVNNDNLNNFFSAAAIFYLHKYLKNSNYFLLVFFVVSILCGLLTKITFLPISLVYILILFFRGKEQNKLNLSKLFEIKKERYISIILVSFLITLNLILYGQNLMRYNSFVPKADQILSEEQAMQNRIYARNKIVESYRTGKIDFEKAMEQVNTIEHIGDRKTALYLLRLTKEHLLEPKPLIDRLQYVEVWLRIMIDRAIGLSGHIYMLKESYWFSVYKLILFVSFLMFVRYWKPLDERILTEAFVICSFYGIVLMQVVNYSTYKETFAIGLAVSGRYFFQVLVPFYGIVAYYLITPFKRSFQIAILTLVSLYFICGDYPYFLFNVTSDWWFR